MPSFLTPYPPTLTRAVRPQARSGSTSFSSASDASSNYFSRFTRGSSSSAYLTDVTPPITPSHTKEHRSRVGDDSTGALLAPESRISRSRPFRDIGEEDGYTTDRESSPLFDAVDVLHSRLEKAAPNANTQRALQCMDKRIKTAIEGLELLDEPLSTPAMPATKVVEAEEALEVWSGDYALSDMSIKDTPSSPCTESGVTPTQKFTLPLNKDQIWLNFADNEFEREFHEGVVEDMGRSYFPDEIKLYPANTFAFGTGSISGWREEPQQPAAIVQAHSPTPPMPDTPVLRPFVDESFEASSLLLNSPSLIYESSVSTSRVLISPQQLDAPSPGVFDLSLNNPHTLLSSPSLAISTAMFGSRRAHPRVGDILHAVEDLDLPALMRMETAAPLARQQQQTVTPAPAEDRALVGLGLEISTPHLPHSFPTCNSLPSIYSLPSWDHNVAPPTSTPLLPSSATMESVTSTVPAFDEDAADFIAALYASADWSRTALSDIAEESAPSSCAATSARSVVGLGLGGLALQSSASITRMASACDEPGAAANRSIIGLGLGGLEGALRSSSSISRLVPEPIAQETTAAGGSSLIGLGLGALVESTLQSTASVVGLCSPEMPSFSSTLGFSATMNLTDVAGPYRSSATIAGDRAALESSGILSGRDHLSMGGNSGSVCNTPGIEPSGVLPDMPCLEPWHYTPGVENWLLRCSEVEPSAPSDMEVVQLSPPATIVGFDAVNCAQAEIEPKGALSAGPVGSIVQTMPTTPLTRNGVRKHSLLRESFVASDLEEGDTLPASPVPKRTVVPASAIEEVARALPASVAGPCAPSASGSRGLKPSKSAEGLGKGLPSGLAALPPRQREVTVSSALQDPASMMSTADECEDIARLAAAPAPGSTSHNVVSQERGAARGFFRIPRFRREKRTLYTIPEIVSPPLSATASPSSQAAGFSSPLGRSLSAAWSDIASRLRSPGTPSSPARSPATPRLPPSCDALVSNTHDAIAAPTLVSDGASWLPQPPRLEPRQPRTSWLSRLSRGSRLPGMIEHLDAPRNAFAAVSLGTGDPPARPSGRKGGRVVRRLQMLF